MGVEHKEKVESSEILQLVSFKIGNEEFGVDILNVQEINKMTQITKVPNAPDFVEGVINLRGRIIPVIDLRTRLKLDKKEHDKDTRIIVVEISNKTVGFIVDAVKEVLRVPVNITEAPPEIVTGIDSEFIKSVGKLDDRLLILMDLDKIITNVEKHELEFVN
ncbi:MAG: chemotaxis protein CheW [Bacteroidetes bacterium]|nr:chemotaxis protein CheW [Bacteroidota bacterium]MCL6100836.1 chemotaxis protein CheW [Bacteroidota bacterium]